MLRLCRFIVALSLLGLCFTSLKRMWCLTEEKQEMFFSKALKIIEMGYYSSKISI